MHTLRGAASGAPLTCSLHRELLGKVNALQRNNSGRGSIQADQRQWKRQNRAARTLNFGEIPFEELGLTSAQHVILVVVRDNPSITQSELAGILQILLPNLEKLLAKFEEDGVLKRTRSKRDRRAVELRLTTRGAELAKESTQLADAFNERTLAPLRPSDRTKFMQMLVRLAAPHPVAQDG